MLFSTVSLISFIHFLFLILSTGSPADFYSTQRGENEGGSVEAQQED
jgi:hypothetical protein